MAAPLSQADVCLICALEEEARAAEEVIQTRCHASFETGTIDNGRLLYRFTTILNTQEEPFTLLLFCQNHQGPVHTALDLRLLIRTFQPRFAAMIGICAGDKRHTQLGDLVVAEYAYHVGGGKVERDEAGEIISRPDGITYGPTESLLQAAHHFQAWKEPVAELKRHLLGTEASPRLFFALMASCMAVRSDDPFLLLQQHHRKTWALDMEAASFYLALNAFPGVASLVVKSICDYADQTKDDTYHTYAAHASALYVLTFIQECVMHTSMPRRSHKQAGSPPLFLVPGRDPFFTGREALLRSLHRFLIPGSITALTQAISGIGGIGKTSIAIEYIYRFAHLFEAVLWLQADSLEQVISGCIILASQLGLPEEQEEDRVLTAIQRWLREHQHWLLILDNVEQVQEILSRLLPAVHQGRVLITTRVQHVEPFAQTQVLAPMSQAEGVLFLLRRTAFLAPTADLRQATIQQCEEAQQVWEALGGLPLALDQAGAYILETSCSFSGYLRQYKLRRTALLHRRGWRVIGHEAPVTTTLSLSIEQVEIRSPLAIDLLRVGAFLAPDAIPEELFSEGAEPLALSLKPNKSLDEALGVLQDYSLIQRNPEGKLLSIHRLVQAVLQDKLEEEEQCTWAERAMLTVSATFPDLAPGTQAQCERLLPQALAAAQAIERYQLMREEGGHLLFKTAFYLDNRGRYIEAESLYLRALHIQEHVLGPDHPEVASILTGLATLHTAQGKYTEAERLQMRALRIKEQQLEPNHPHVGESFLHLAVTYFEQGKYAEAEPLYLRALQILEQAQDSELLQVTVALTGLGVLYAQQGKYTKAEALLLRALRIREQALGFESANSLLNLAGLYYDQGKYAEAEPLYLRAQELWEQQLGPEHPSVAYPLLNLANIYTKQGKYTEAEPLYLRVLQIREQQGESDHPLRAGTLSGLANLYRAQEHYAEAEPLFQRALSIQEQTLEPHHPDLAQTLSDFALLRTMQGNALEAIPLYSRALAIQKHLYGPEHLATTETRLRLRAALVALGKTEEVAQLDTLQPEQEEAEREQAKVQVQSSLLSDQGTTSDFLSA